MTTFEWKMSNKWGYAASLSLIPYAILKTLWAFGVTIMISEKGIEELHASMRTSADSVSSFLYSCGIDITAILAVIASLLALALVRPWGRNVPRLLVLIPAWLGGITFIIVSIANCNG
ncbi:hypothetical protein ABES25_15650 [Bacillus gobiensis]|uniref:hypothetical protein n=1 Tax=Bacillus gobiensis TaxID=1441095 RepID=UPI003D1DBAA0